MSNAILHQDYSEDCIPNFNVNMEHSRHRWYSFKEGYSSALVQRAINEYKLENNKEMVILDPFSGSGTTALVAAENSIDSLAIEVNPFLAYVSRAKSVSTKRSEKYLLKQLKEIISIRPYEVESPLENISTFSYRPELKKWLYNISVLRGFESLKQGIQSISEGFPPFMLALYSAMADCSNAKRDGKCLRYKRDWSSMGFSSIELRNRFEMYARQVIRDVTLVPLGTSEQTFINNSVLNSFNSKIMGEKKFDLTVFSPPYLNSFDYTDVYRPELYLGDFVKSQDDLKFLRSQTLRSHVQYKWDTYDKSSSQQVEGLVEMLKERSSILWDKGIPGMVSSYFADMEQVLNNIYNVSNKDAAMWIVVSTSSYAGIEIPVDNILAELGGTVGWELSGIHTLRKIRGASQNESIKLRESLIRFKKRG
ncbi:DNA methyltransferase [Paenibacillus sp. PAMC 26794]|uniref:DNA methyltransferase n=1 Tax=Paenibacillus sp. PAMC 26794 TaxID=1257080 RepID=UPI00031803E5|nr:DNA methyltransferase [Paenibacillus sp. PAMC 26794]